MADRVARRLAAQGLSGPAATSVDAVVARLLAVQAQDGRAARLAVRARSVGLRATDVDAALDARRLVVSWLNRGTLHLVTADDYWWLHELTAPRTVTANTTRLRQEGVDPAQAERGVEVVADAVRAGPQTRNELRERLAEAGVPTKGQALVHVLMAASLRGLAVRGPVVGADHAFVSPEAWLGPRPLIDRDDALVRLARRYLAGHAPADDRDLAKWSGLPLGDTRRALRLVAGDDVVGRRSRAAAPPARLLGPFDPLLLGWASREWVVGPHQRLVTVNGIFRSVALVRGRAAGTWRLDRGVVHVDLFEPVSASARRALADDAADVLRFLGLPPADPTVTMP